MHPDSVEYKIDVAVSKTKCAGCETGCSMRAEFSNVNYNNVA